MARPLTLDKETNSCITIGFKLTEEFKKIISFSTDTNIIKKTVNETCERCGIEDCNDRAAAPHIYNKEKTISLRKELLDSLVQDFD